MATTYERKFLDSMADIFQLNQAELDFGIYRIMNQKRADIDRFLNIRLMPEVTQVLKENTDEGADISAIENEVFSHLTKFFNRYYDGGDFISKRRYKDNTYAIPYSGEEVKLYWANADQYYIKTSEYFKNYAFHLPVSHRKVHFLLRDAETEQNNNKAANNMERRFALCEEDFIAEADGELNIFFTYELMPKATKQDALIKEAETKLQPVITEQYPAFAELVTTKAPTEKNKDRSLLMKRLQDYTAKNTFDYFIHKDLGGFLRRELDFYIKNEVMFLDDLDASHILSHLAQVKAIKQVGEKIITFLAQLEDFQKKLWLKKKFVVGCDYCITLDRIPRDLYSEVIRNEAQRQEWVRLFAIDEVEGYSESLTTEFLAKNPFLVLDTKFFSADFKHKVVESMENVDEECNGVLINSENFQALELLQERYGESVKCVYIDPPYNTDGDGFMYKDRFQDSSWLAMMQDRIAISRNIMNISGAFFSSIDDNEVGELKILMNQNFGCENFEGHIHWRRRSNQPNDKNKMLGLVAEHILSYAKSIENNKAEGVGKLSLTGTFSNPDNDPKGAWASKPWKAGSDQSGCRYDITSPTGVVFCEDWLGEEKTYRSLLADNRIYFPNNGNGSPRKKYYKSEREEEGQCATNWWGHDQFGNNQGANVVMTNLFGIKNIFSNPKPVELVKGTIQVTNRDTSSNILDYFAGSGTTGHAVINLNREDNGNRKYILVEMGTYFNTVTKPRIEKVIYSEDWKNGKPVSRKGTSQCFKYLRLEQYEDTLNNLQTSSQQLAFKGERADFEESYLLSYMLDTETKGDLFNLQWFVHPFDMTLKTTKDNELVETKVDMVETFNYLIGLEVETMRWPKDGYCVVEGKMHTTGERTLVIWRDCEKVSNDALNDFFRKQAYSTTDAEFDKIYVNGDNTLPNIKKDEERWKVMLIEEEFKKRMFEG